MKLSRDSLEIAEFLDQDKVTWYRVEFRLKPDDEFYFSSANTINKINCIKLIEQLDGLSLTEANLIVNEGNYGGFDSRSYGVIIFPHLTILYNGEETLVYYGYDGSDMYDYDGNFKKRDILHLQVVKNELLK